MVSFSISPDFGSFTGRLAPIIGLTGGFILLFISKFLKSEEKIKPDYIAPLILIFSYLLLVFYHDGMWAKTQTPIMLIDRLIGLFFIPIIIFSFLKIKNFNVSLIIYLAYIVLALILRVIMLKATPFPFIDVFIILKEAPMKFLSGINPYNTLYTHVFPGITPDYYAYWPVSFLLQIPFVLLFKDPRILLIIADIASSILIYLIAGKGKTGQFLSLAYLFRPHSLFIIESSWLTPLNFFFICLLVFFLQKKAAKTTLGIALGVLTGIQFFHAIIIFSLFKWLHYSKIFLISSLLTILLIAAPFFITAPSNFFSRTIWVYFRNPPHPSILIHTSLSLNTLLFYFTGKDIPALIYALISGGIFIFYLLRLKRSLSSLIETITMTFFAIFLFGRQAFVNYYYFIGSMLVLWLATLAYEKDS